MQGKLKEPTKELIINILYGLKELKIKVRLALVSMLSIIDGISREDCLIGLEMDARNLIQQRQMF